MIARNTYMRISGAFALLSLVISASTLASPSHSILTKQDGRIISSCKSDLDADGIVETVVITARTQKDRHPMGGDVVVMQTVGGKLKPVWRQEKLNPWKLQIADVDDDGKCEIVVGVWKKSPKDPVMAKRTFVYSWDGRRMLPKWLGSRLSRRFDDFALCDINRDGWDELLALEICANGKHRVSAYRWQVFGFDWLGCSSEVSGLQGLDFANGRPVVRAYGYKMDVKYSAGKIILNRKKGDAKSVKHH